MILGGKNRRCDFFLTLWSILQHKKKQELIDDFNTSSYAAILCMLQYVFILSVFLLFLSSCALPPKVLPLYLCSLYLSLCVCHSLILAFMLTVLYHFSSSSLQIWCSFSSTSSLSSSIAREFTDNTSPKKHCNFFSKGFTTKLKF